MTSHQMLLAMGAAGEPLAFDQISNGGAGGGGGGSGSSYSWSHTCSGSNRALIVCVNLNTFGGISISSVTYNGVGMTLVAGVTASNSRRSAIYKLSNPASGSNTVQVNLSGASDSSATSISFTGAHQTTGSLTGTAVTASGSDSSDPSVTGIGSASNEICVDSAVVFSPDWLDVGAGQTFRDAAGDSTNRGVFVSTEPGAASVSMSQDITNGGGGAWAYVGVSVKPP